MFDDPELAKLLEKACPNPTFLASSNGGPVLSLALHVLMVEAGFVLSDEAGHRTKPAVRFQPPKDWHGVLHDQWVFTYKKPGKARKFTLHCSLQVRTKRMFVHCSEENNVNNVHVLGLQLDNYVPDSAALKTGRWAQSPSQTQPAPPAEPDPNGAGPTPVPAPPTTVVINAAKMQSMLQEYIIQPLLLHAEDLAEEGQAEAEATTSGSGGSGSGSVLGDFFSGRWLNTIGESWRVLTGRIATASEASLVELEQQRRRTRAAQGAVVCAAAVVTAAVVVAVAQGARARAGSRGGGAA